MDGLLLGYGPYRSTVTFLYWLSNILHMDVVSSCFIQEHRLLSKWVKLDFLIVEHIIQETHVTRCAIQKGGLCRLLNMERQATASARAGNRSLCASSHGRQLRARSMVT